MQRAGTRNSRSHQFRDAFVLRSFSFVWGWVLYARRPCCKAEVWFSRHLFKKILSMPKKLWPCSWSSWCHIWYHIDIAIISYFHWSIRKVKTTNDAQPFALLFNICGFYNYVPHFFFPYVSPVLLDTGRRMKVIRRQSSEASASELRRWFWLSFGRQPLAHNSSAWSLHTK